MATAVAGADALGARRPAVVARAFAPWWLRLSEPLAVLGAASAVLALFWDGPYAQLTESMRRQGRAQDFVNVLLAFPALLLLGRMARHGSKRALLAWTGVVASIAYAYVMYAFDVAFGPLFLLYVAVFGLSVWALGGALAYAQRTPWRDSFEPDTPRRLVGCTLLALASFFYFVWLSTDVPALLAGTTPAEVVAAGVPTSAVHVLDMALFLPACVVAGVALLRGRAVGYWLAPVMLTGAVFIAVAVAAIGFVEAASTGAKQAVGLGVGFALFALALLLVLAWFLAHVDGRRRALAVRF